MGEVNKKEIKSIVFLSSFDLHLGCAAKTVGVLDFPRIVVTPKELHNNENTTNKQLGRVGEN